MRIFQLTMIFQTYADPPAISPVHNRPKDEKAFDNTAFVDYEEPLSIKTEYYQLNDVLEPNESGNAISHLPFDVFVSVEFLIQFKQIPHQIYYCRVKLLEFKD